MKTTFQKITFAALLLATSITNAVAQEKTETLNVLFIGNSYTARHNLPDVVKAMAEEANPNLDFKVSKVIYGGRTLSDHWRLGTANFVRRHEVTKAEIEASITKLEPAAETDKYAKGAIKNLKALISKLETPHPKWDVVVLQSYRDDIEGEPTKYAKFAPKFAELIKAQGARVVLYETSPTTQNAEPLTEAPDAASVQKKAEAIVKLAKEIDASVAPMSLASLHCQTERPDFTLRFINDAHLNHTMAYMTACALYAAIFDQTPVGLKFDTVTDIRHFEKEPKNKQKDRDGNPITRVFSDKDREDLQRFAWKAYTEMHEK